MIAPWFFLFLDPGRRVLLAGAEGEVTELLAEPAVKPERIQNTASLAKATSGLNFCNPTPDMVLGSSDQADILCRKRPTCMLRSGDSKGKSRCSMRSSSKAITRSRW